LPKEKVLFIIEKISEYISSKKNKIPYHNFIIDFTLWENSVKLVNISPLEMWSGADWKLFNWTDNDKILQTEKIYFKYIDRVE
jgi:hypothetical protein